MSAANKWSRAGRGSVQKWDHIRSKIWYRSRTALISTGIPRAGNEKIVAFCHIPGMSKEKRHGCDLFVLPPTNISPEGKECCRTGKPRRPRGGGGAIYRTNHGSTGTKP